MMVCQLYDSNSPNATLIGVEYMITTHAYNQLPAREQPNWHYHKEEFAPNRAHPKFPLLAEQQQNATLKKLEESYGKVILTGILATKVHILHKSSELEFEIHAVR